MMYNQYCYKLPPYNHHKNKREKIMSSLDKLFANSFKNDVDYYFLQSVEAISTLEKITSSDFLRKNKVKVYTPEIKKDYSLKKTPLSFTSSYSQVETYYDILGVWLYKLSENLRRIYSAKKKSNDFSSLIEQQNNLYSISHQLLDYWDSLNEPTFFPRAIFGIHSHELPPFDYLIYLAFHDCLTPGNFQHHSTLLQKFFPRFDFQDFPDFFPKLALSPIHIPLFKQFLPLIPPSSLVERLKFYPNSDGFNLLSFQYILENQSLFTLDTSDKVTLIQQFLHNNILLSRHFDHFVSDKTVFLDHLSQFISREVSQQIELLFINVCKKYPQYKPFSHVFIRDGKKSNPHSLMKELTTLSFEDIQLSYSLSKELISETIQLIQLSPLSKNKHFHYSQFKNLVEKLHPVLHKEHIATIISVNSEFLSFCYPVYLHLRLNESFTPKNSSSALKNKI